MTTSEKMTLLRFVDYDAHFLSRNPENIIKQTHHWKSCENVYQILDRKSNLWIA